ncbi:NUDIX hydrolase [Frisingicoccus sp.]|uniref:NUDIX hydrolase n=1 Tax=Frisingicoccus sp. TaxID=1918627 RepID=UPI002EB13EBD|nr:CoA pyrophosphatase [Frisingicoccus sp.]
MLEKLRGRKPALIDYEKYRRSAVVIPLIKKQEGYEVLFEVRASNLKHQPGEICFPGGGCELNETQEESACREICEELLIQPEQVEMVAPMDILVLPSNMILYPFLAELEDYKGTFSRDEVEEVFTVPLKYFLDTEPQTYYNKVCNVPQEDFPFDKIEGGQDYKWYKGKYPVHFYEYGDRVIWGMTARIMNSVAGIIRETEGGLA